MGRTSIFAKDRISALLHVNAKGVPDAILKHRDKLRETSPGIADFWFNDHLAAVEWAKDLIGRPDSWCANDTETTGVSDASEVVECAIVRGDGEVVFNSMFKPVGPLNPRALAITGITREQLAQAPAYSRSVERINATFRQFREVVIYNAQFERRVYSQTAFSTDSPDVILPNVITDPLPHVAAFIGEWDTGRSQWKYAKLEGGHRAVNDCIAMIEIIRLMATSPIAKLL